jgi:sugar phosphate isomerase/epimerase
MMNPFEADPQAYRTGGWTAFELWLTKLESYVQDHSLAKAREVLEAAGIHPVAAALQGGLLLSRGLERATHWDHFRRRLDVLRDLGVPTMIIAADSASTLPAAEDYARAAAGLHEAAELAATFGVRIALEFQKSSPVCACLETALALVAQAGSRNAGVCLDAFHFQTGPSKLEDLGGLTRESLAWVHVCDLSGTPRELAGDRDRILPGDGDLPLGPIIERLGEIGYDGFVSLELFNPHLWQVAADRVADLGYQSLRRTLGRWMTGPAEAESEGGN